MPTLSLKPVSTVFEGFGKNYFLRGLSCWNFEKVQNIYGDTTQLCNHSADCLYPSLFPSYNMWRDAIPWGSYIIGWEVWMLNSSTGLWVGLLGIVLGVLGFFYAPLWLGAGAVLLGLVALAYSHKLVVGWISLILGVIVLILTLWS